MTMNENKKKMYDLSGPKTVEAMKKRHFDAYYCSTAAEAVEKALELIREKACPLSEVGWEVGIGEYKYFNHVFKKYMGCSAREYQQMV